MALPRDSDEVFGKRLSVYGEVQPLSPAAQAVKAAATRLHGCIPEAIAAAALRAAVDQVVPESRVYEPTGDGTMRCVNELWVTRRVLYAIAAELDSVHAQSHRHRIFPTPHQIAECGGPCEQGGPEACDCGLSELI